MAGLLLVHGARGDLLRTALRAALALLALLDVLVLPSTLCSLFDSAWWHMDRLPHSEDAKRGPGRTWVACPAGWTTGWSRSFSRPTAGGFRAISPCPARATAAASRTT